MAGAGSERGGGAVKNPYLLNEPMLLILFILRDGPRHGYNIMIGIDARSNAEFTIAAGTLYRSLAALVEMELIEYAPELLSEDEDSQRKYYRITSMGRVQLAFGVERLETLIALIDGWEPKANADQ
jgi:DNA-binding PadR family transcriptional regulator